MASREREIETATLVTTSLVNRDINVQTERLGFSLIVEVLE